MKKFFKVIGIINFLFIVILAIIFLKVKESGGELVLRNAPIFIFFINLFSFTIISTVILNIDIRKKLNYMISESNKIIFKVTKCITILTTILILTFGLWIEFFIFAFSASTTEYTMKINDTWIIASYDSFFYDIDEPQFYYPVNLFYMRPANISSNEYSELCDKFKESYRY